MPSEDVKPREITLISIAFRKEEAPDWREGTEFSIDIGTGVSGYFRVAERVTGKTCVTFVLVLPT